MQAMPIGIDIAKSILQIHYIDATRYNGMIHDFGLLNVLSDVPTTRIAMHQAGYYHGSKQS